MDIAEWESAGLYLPDAEGADDRRAVLEYLSARGATTAQMLDAQRTGNLPGLAGDLVVAKGRPSLSLDEVAERSGLEVDRVRRVLLASGFPVDADSEMPDDLVELMQAFEQGASLMGDEAILAFTRVVGASATNIAEAAVALFYAELGPGTGREGMTELERARIAERATLAFTAVPAVLSGVLLAQFDRAVIRTQRTRGWAPPPPDAVDAGIAGSTGELAALGFVDLVGSSAWAETLGLREQSLALSRFESTAWASAVQAGGRVIKMIGDEVFFAAPSVSAACRIATDVCRTVAVDPVLPPARGAVGYGLVTPREGDYFGPLVNLVARLVKVATPGAVVITDAAAAALTDGGWTLSEIGPQRLRGFENLVNAFEVDEGPHRVRGA
jgi:adenylate cyclase